MLLLSKVFGKILINKMLSLMLHCICLMISEIVLEHIAVFWIITKPHSVLVTLYCFNCSPWGHTESAMTERLT